MLFEQVIELVISRHAAVLHVDGTERAGTITVTGAQKLIMDDSVGRIAQGEKEQCLLRGGGRQHPAYPLASAPASKTLQDGDKFAFRVFEGIFLGTSIGRSKPFIQHVLQEVCAIFGVVASLRNDWIGVGQHHRRLGNIAHHLRIVPVVAPFHQKLARVNVIGGGCQRGKTLIHIAAKQVQSGEIALIGLIHGIEVADDVAAGKFGEFSDAAIDPCFIFVWFEAHIAMDLVFEIDVIQCEVAVSVPI